MWVSSAEGDAVFLSPAYRLRIEPWGEGTSKALRLCVEQQERRVVTLQTFRLADHTEKDARRLLEDFAARLREAMAHGCAVFEMPARPVRRTDVSHMEGETHSILLRLPSWCGFCQRASHTGEWSLQGGRCAYCEASAVWRTGWTLLREEFPDIPERPQEGKVYNLLGGPPVTIPFPEFDDRMHVVLSMAPEELLRRESEFQKQQAEARRGKTRAA